MLLAAFGIGILLLGAVLLLPGFSALFHVTRLSAVQLWTVVGMAAGSLLVIQLLKAVRMGIK